MLRSHCLTMILLVFPLSLIFADERTDSTGNAALKYWQAFATLPRFTEAENNKIAEPLTTPLDELARKILLDAEYSLKMIHYGSSQSRCDWGVSQEEGVFTRLPHAQAARVVTSLICLRARTRLEAGQTAEAIDDIVDGMILGRHITQDGTNILLLTGYAIEHRLIDALALYIPKLDARTIADARKRLAAIPAGATPVDAMASEEHCYLDWFDRALKKAKDKDSLLALLTFVGIEPEGSPKESADKIRSFIEECGGTVEGVLRCSQETRGSYRRVAKMLALPLDQFEKDFDRESQKGMDNPVFKIFFPAVVNVRRAQARIDVRRAMLSAALAIGQEGPAALKSNLDPVVGGPFEYVPFEGGFELISHLNRKGDKPVTLTVGQRH